jgi:hypothetical protein
MPTTTFIVSRNFASEHEVDDQLLIDERGNGYWAQGRLHEADVLIPLSIADFQAHLEGFLAGQRKSRQPIEVTLEWGDARLDEQDHLYAGYNRFSFTLHNPGDILKNLRKEAAEKTGARISQAYVARETKLDPKTVSLLELGKVQSISQRSAQALARFYSRIVKRKLGPQDLGYPVMQPPRRKK